MVMEKIKLVLASNNEGKIREFKEILPARYEIITMQKAGFTDEIAENGSSFYENALIKAKTVSLALGVDAVADDSGLVVEALGGAPGIFSARYSGAHGDDAANRAKLLKNMLGISDRRAKFVSAIVLYKTDGTIIRGDGEALGEILYEERGKHGFGYDPLFYSRDLKKSFGEATDEEKNSVSHRKRALIDLLEHL